MAQRFIIDGNFTQSFNGKINISADACPADFEIRPSLYYDINSGDVCYEYDDRICFDYTFGFSTQQNRLWTTTPSSPNYSPDVSGFANLSTAGKGIISFLQSGSDPAYPTIPVRTVTNDLSKTFSILINTQSAAGKDLNAYITQNSVSGSIVLSSASETVEFRYGSQTTPATLNTWKDQVLLGTNQLTSSNSTLQVLVATNDTPFANGDKICVEVRPLGITPSLQEVMEVGNSTTLTMTSSNEVTVYGTDNNSSIILNDVVIKRSSTDALRITNDDNNGAYFSIYQGGGKETVLAANGGVAGQYPRLQFQSTDNTSGNSAGQVMGSIQFMPYNTPNGSFAFISAVTTEDQRTSNTNGGLLRFAATKAGEISRTTLLELNADDGAVFYTDITASGFISASSGHITGDLTVLGTGSFKVIKTVYETSSIIYSSGSTKFGDSFDDFHIFTGSLYIDSSPISASISASSYLHASASDANGNYTNVVTYDTSTGRFYYTGSYGAGGEETLQETMEFGSSTSIAISSSAPTALSASGDIHVNNITASGDITASGFYYDHNNTSTEVYVDGNITASNHVKADQFLYVRGGSIYGTNNVTYLQILDKRIQFRPNGDLMFNISNDSGIGNEGRTFTINPATNSGISGIGRKGVNFSFFTSGSQTATNYFNGTSTEKPFLEASYLERTFIIGQSSSKGPDADNDHTLIVSGNVDIVGNSIGQVGHLSAAGNLFASLSYDTSKTTDGVVVYDTTTDQFYYTGSYGGGGSSIDTGSLLITASATDAVVTFTKGDTSTFEIEINNVTSSITASTTNLLQSLTANQDVGAITSGDTFAAGTSIETLLRTMLITFIQSSIGTPLFKNNGSTVGASTREVNSSFEVDQVTFTAVDNDPDGNYPINLTVTASGADTGNFANDLTDETLGASNTFDLDSNPYTLNITSISAGYSRNITLTINAEDPDNSAALTESKNYQYIYPYYWGESATDLSSATGTILESTSGINKVLSGRTNKTHSIAASAEYIYFAYPKLYGSLVEILDGTNVDVLPGNFTQYEITIDGGNGWSGVDYYLYRSNTVTTVTGNYKFNFT